MSNPRRRWLLVLGVVVLVVLTTSWIGRLQRCRAEIGRLVAIESAATRRGEDPASSDVTPLYVRVQQAVQRACDRPVWGWWTP